MQTVEYARAIGVPMGDSGRESIANSAAWVGEGAILCVRLRRPDRDALIDRSLDQLAS